MPRTREPKTLKKSAILSIAVHWDIICYGCHSIQEMNALLESEEYLNTKGPFTSMPASLLEEMLEVIGATRSLTRKHLHVLMLDKLRTIHLGFGTGEIYYGLRFLRRCKKLQTLNLPYLRHIEPSELLGIIPYLTCIVSLNLQMTYTIDQVLASIADHCPNLCELNLSSTLVSDKGIMSLCGVEQNDGVRRCQKLRRLIVTETRVTWVGALYAVQNFPELTDFDFDKIFLVFEHLDPSSLVDLLPTLKLRSLYSTLPCVRGDSIEAAAMLCPNAEILSIMNAWMDNEMLYKFMKFEKLRTLTLVNSDGFTLDYDEGVLPLLQICGPILENLILNKFKSVDLISLGKSCPRLRKMALCNIAEYQTSDHPVEGLFKYLSILELWFDEKTEYLSTNPILQLLNSCVNLSNLLVKKSDSFRTSTLEQVWRTNPMKLLSRLTLDECQSLEPELLEEFLVRENDLVVIRVWGCPKVTRTHQDTLQAYITNNNLDVYLEWFP